MFISRVTLTNWKNFKSTEADLSERVFVIGPNASGKSNFLDALRFLRDVAKSGMEEAISIRNGVSSIRCLAARKSPDINIAVHINDEVQDRWFYQLEFNQDRQKNPTIKREIVIDLRSGKKIVERPDSNDREDPILLSQTSLEQISENREFRELLEFFESISYQHLIPQAVRDPRGFSPGQLVNDPFGRDLLLRIWDMKKNERRARLKRISAVMSKAIPQLNKFEIEMDKRGSPHLYGRFDHWRGNDAKHDESKFSDGTLRLFGLMWSMFDGSGPLLLEEPELSIHPELVRQFPSLLFKLKEEIRKMRSASWNRQVIISTHSKDMLRDNSIGSGEVLRIDPSPEGSKLSPPSGREKKMMSSGLSAADAIFSRTGPDNSEQLLISF